MYSLGDYGYMIADRVRIEAYRQALRGAIRPGSVVVDIGTGPGIISVLACQLGASRVFAIEPDEIIQVARETAAVNHCADKIQFFENLSTKVTLPVPADVIVSDMRGVLPFFGQHIPSIVDARRRFLAPGGLLIPQKDTVWVSVGDVPEQYGKIVDSWEHNPLGQDLSPARRRVVNDFHKTRVSPGQLLVKPQVWATLDYASIENSDARAEIEWTVERTGTGHGILAWFDADLGVGVGLSNAPGAPEAIYGSAFFPWPKPVPLAAGQTVRVDLAANLGENNYVWRWITCIQSLENPGETITRFEQSQLQGDVLSPASLRKCGSDYFPEVSEEGRVHRRALELMDGKASLEAIARQLAAEFPQRFSHWHKALSYAGPISQKYSK